MKTSVLYKRMTDRRDQEPPVLRFSTKKLDAACVAWKRADRARRFHALAARVRVSQRTLENWRSGATMPTADELFALMSALGASLDDLTE